jgi:ribosomal-protein-alanine N-acetyltransferase
MNLILETPRLVLREMTLADLDFVAAMLADPEVMRFYPKCYTREESEDWIRRNLERYARDGHGRWLVLDRVTGQPVGQVGLIRQEMDGLDEAEVGYMIHRPFWRRGLATEAALATRDHAFDVLGKAYVISLVRPENAPSQGVARKLGMRPRKPSGQHGCFEHLVFEVTRAERDTMTIEP